MLTNFVFILMRLVHEHIDVFLPTIVNVKGKLVDSFFYNDECNLDPQSM